MKNELRGVVTKSTGSNYLVRTPTSEIIQCSIKGKFRIKGIKTTNPVAVGDHVLYTYEENNVKGVIHEILPRKNYIIRRSSNLSKLYHIIASNVDLAVLMVSFSKPETPLEFIDRFLVTAEAYSIPVLIVINKTDIYDYNMMESATFLAKAYKKIGYDTLMMSVMNDTNVHEFMQKIESKVSVISGNSGVGKSTLINKINPSLNLKTSSISVYHKTGKHTTTFAEMFELFAGTFIIDTPGIRGFGTIDIEKNELYHYFPEIFRASHQCRYNNCIHLNEPGCNVMALVESEEILKFRYFNYLNMLTGEESKYRI